MKEKANGGQSRERTVSLHMKRGGRREGAPETGGEEVKEASAQEGTRVKERGSGDRVRRKRKLEGAFRTPGKLVKTRVLRN